MSRTALIDTCYKKSIQKLLENSTDYGLLAAGVNDKIGKLKNYETLFSRDIGVSSIGILASKNKQLILTLKVSLTNLALAQSDLGQLPFYYRPETKQSKWWNPGSIDSTIWWCISFLLYYQEMKDEDFYQTFLPQLEKAFLYLRHQDTNNDTLLEQGEASDWGDEFPRRGAVLYTNSLWYYFVSLRADVEKRKDCEVLKDKVYEAFNTLFTIHKGKDDNIDYIPNNDYVKNNMNAKGTIELINAKSANLPYYVGYVTHRGFEDRCDVYGNILACLFGLASKEKTLEFVDYVLRSGINVPYPVKVLYPPIYPGEMDFTEYMRKRGQNFPYQYHNGGIWPYVGAFWVMLLTHVDKQLAEEELYRVAEANKINDWEFNEYLHGLHGTPMGVPNQTWNMGCFIAAYLSLYKVKKDAFPIFTFPNISEQIS
jgi:glycogen debranching enzyme